MARIELSLPKLDVVKLLTKEEQTKYLGWLADAHGKIIFLQQQSNEYGGLSPEAIAAMPAAFSVFMDGDESKAGEMVHQVSLAELKAALAEMQVLVAGLGQQIETLMAQILNAPNN